MPDPLPQHSRDDSRAPDPSESSAGALEIAGYSIQNEIPQHHRELLNAYRSCCRADLTGVNRLIERPSNMRFEDLNSFAHLEERVRDNVYKTVQRHGTARDCANVYVRTLQHVVAVSKTQRERHLFVDVVGSECASVLAWKGCMEQFVTGPVALHVYISDYQSKHIIVRPLMSKPAFKEAVTNLSRLADGQIQATSDSSWGMKLIISAVNSHHSGLLDGVQERRIKASDLCNFRHVQREFSAKELFCFEIGSVEYQAELALNEERNRPDVYLYTRFP